MAKDKKNRGKAAKPRVARPQNVSTSLPPAVDRLALEQLVERFDRLNYERWERYNEFLQTLRPLPGLARAEAWLEYVAGNQERFGEEEALVYLVSRGRDMELQAAATRSRWQEEEKAALDRAGEQPVTWNSDGTFHRRDVRVHAVNRRIEDTAEWSLGDFWYARSPSDWTLDATMFRAVEWCDIGGFDGWLRRYANRQWRDALEGGFDRTPLAYFLFAMARSPFAICSAARAWERMLDVLEFPVDGRDSWEQPLMDGDLVTVRAQLGRASCTAFAAARIRGQAVERDLAERVVSLLIAQQRDDGGWSTWAGHGESDTLTTAQAMHALSTRNALGRTRALRLGAQWLWDHQSEFGAWTYGDGRGDDVFLTVLCLDAIALADGGSTTLTPPTDPATGAVGKALTRGASAKRFAVAFSFPGEQRQRVKRLAEGVAKVLGRAAVLYDDFHKGELARPDADLYLQELYADSALIVVVLCADYERKAWCAIEFRAIRQLISERPGDIMFLRAGPGDVKGIFGNVDIYLDITTTSDEEVVTAILSRLADRP